MSILGCDKILKNTSKRRVERCFTTKNAIEYIKDYAVAAERKAGLFGL